VRSKDEGQRRQTFRLITTLLDHQAYPAAQVAALYPAQFSRTWPRPQGVVGVLARRS